jgi:hypothetical protein
MPLLTTRPWTIASLSIAAVLWTVTATAQVTQHRRRSSPTVAGDHASPHPAAVSTPASSASSCAEPSAPPEPPPARAVGARQAPPVVVVVTQAVDLVDPSAVRSAVGGELREPIVSPYAADAGRARAVIRIAIDDGRRATVSHWTTNNRERYRVTTLPADPTAAVAILAMIAGNLARNEAHDLARTMTHRPEGERRPGSDATTPAARPTELPGWFIEGAPRSRARVRRSRSVTNPSPRHTRPIAHG